MEYKNGELFNQLRRMAEDPDFKLSQKQSMQLLFAGMAGLREHIDNTTEETSKVLHEVKHNLEANNKEHAEIKEHLKVIVWIGEHPKIVVSGILVLGVLFGIAGGSFWHIQAAREFIIQKLLTAL